MPLDATARDPMMPWSGNVPAAWHAKRLKWTVERITRKASGGEGRYVGLENIEPWSGRMSFIANKISSDSLGNVFEKGDVLFGKLRPYLAKVFLTNDRGIGSSEFLILRGRDLLPEFLQYVLLSEAFIKLVDSST